MPKRISRRALLAAAPAIVYGADERLAIRSVKAYPVKVGGLFRDAPPKFTSDYDPARWRWFGPFAQLAGALIVEIQTEKGITGYGLGSGGGAGAYIIEHHLKDLLIGVNALNTELLWDQMYSSTL